MRAFLILSYTANIILAVVSLHLLPPEVAIHFGTEGMADSWISREMIALFSFLIDTAFLLILMFSPRLIGTIPAQWINIPNGDYWLAPKRQTRARTMLADAMDRFGVALFIFMFCIGVLTVRANLSDPVRLDERLFLGCMGVFLIVTVIWVIRLYRRFRIPDDHESPMVFSDRDFL